MGQLPEQTVEDFDIGSRKLAKWGTLMISLAGGEPLLREDIVDIVRLISRWHMPFITTNGYQAYEELAHALFAAGLWGISVSIDYANAERHDRARGVPGAYERAVRALDMFSRARKFPWQRVNLMAVLLDDNLEEIEPLIQLAADYDAYFMIQPYSILKTGSKKFRHVQTYNVGEYLLKMRKKYPNFLSNPLFLSKFDAALDGGVPGCSAGKAFFNIDSTGDIAICVEQRKSPIANLYRDDMTTISKQLMKHSKRNSCRQCWYNCRGEIECLYNLYGLIKSLPTYLFDQGRPYNKYQSHVNSSTTLKREEGGPKRPYVSGTK